MKYVVALFLGFVYVWAQDPSVTIRPPGSVEQGGVCQHQSDCGDGLCCVSSNFGRRKKFLFSNNGVCEPYRRLNESCLPFMTHDVFNHELYNLHCPCLKTLDCRGETVDEGPHSIQHVNPKCQTLES